MALLESLANLFFAGVPLSCKEGRLGLTLQLFLVLHHGHHQDWL